MLYLLISFFCINNKFISIENNVKNLIKNNFNNKNIKITYESRIKKSERIIEKINRGRTPYDIYGIRIIYNDIYNLYNKDIAFKIKNTLLDYYNSIPVIYDDYINYPKNNGYMSLHIYIIDEIIVELQIRSLLMHYIAINGTASNYY